MLNNGQVVDRRVVRLETVRELLFILTRRDHGRRSFCQQRFVSSKTGSWRHGTSMRPPLDERIGLGHYLVAALPFESGRSLTVHRAKSSRSFPSPSRFPLSSFGAGGLGAGRFRYGVGGFAVVAAGRRFRSTSLLCGPVAA
jgi:hypothetical protein